MQKRKFLPSATCVYGETKEIQHTSHNEISEPKPLVIRSDTVILDHDFWIRVTQYLRCL